MAQALCLSCQAALELPGAAPGEQARCPACGTVFVAEAPELMFDFGPQGADRPAGGEGARAQAAVGSAVFWLGLLFLVDSVLLAGGCVSVVLLALGPSRLADWVRLLPGTCLHVLELALVAQYGLQRPRMRAESFPLGLLVGALLGCLAGSLGGAFAERALRRPKQGGAVPPPPPEKPA